MVKCKHNPFVFNPSPVLVVSNSISIRTSINIRVETRIRVWISIRIVDFQMSASFEKT